MPYCEKCGSKIDTQANFCGNCGAPRRKTPTPQPSNNNYMPPPPPPPQSMQTPTPPEPKPEATFSPPTQPSGEATVGVIMLRKPKSLGRYDSYTGVVTTQRMIFAQMKSAMITEAGQQARMQAKSEGKGFWGQWSDQLKASFGYAQRYLNMSPQEILAETPGNFEVPNNAINELKLHLKDRNYENQTREFELKIKSNAGTFEFRMDENNDFTDLLKKVYGERVKMPFGYFSSKGVRFSVGLR